MAIVEIEGKQVTLPDDVVNAGHEAIAQVLVANGFPALEKADIRILGEKASDGQTRVSVSPHSTGKGGVPRREIAQFIRDLSEAPEHINPAIRVATEIMQAEATGDPEAFGRVARSGVLERVIAEGEREGRAVLKAMQALGHCIPASSTDVPPGF